LKESYLRRKLRELRILINNIRLNSNKNYKLISNKVEEVLIQLR
jgi:hypothetical protein